MFCICVFSSICHLSIVIYIHTFYIHIYIYQTLYGQKYLNSKIRYATYLSCFTCFSVNHLHVVNDTTVHSIAEIKL